MRRYKQIFIDIPVLKLKRLSLFGIEFDQDDIGWFCESLDSVGKSLDALYISPVKSSTSDPNFKDTRSYATFEDSWFVRSFLKKL